MTPRSRAEALATDLINRAASGGVSHAALADLIERALDDHTKEWLAALSAANPGVFAMADNTPIPEVNPQYDAGPIVEATTLPAPCPSAPYHRLRWEKENRHQVCQDCGAEFRAGTCVVCGRPATSRDSFSCGGSHR